MNIQDNRPSAEVPAAPTAKVGPLAKRLLPIAGVDEATIRLCPPQDLSAIMAVTWLLVATGIYSATIFSAIAHRLFGSPGQIEPGLIGGAVAIAAFIIAIDSYVFLRCSWFEAGVQELMRVGLDISGGGGPGHNLKNKVFLGIRVGLSVCLAMLTGVFFSMIVFDKDISARIEKTYQQANRDLFRESRSIVDGDIQRTTDAVNAGTSQVAALSDQITSLRQGEISGGNAGPEAQDSEQEIKRLSADKTKADEEVRKAETFASHERGGFGGSDHSGHAGVGPKYRAALEDAANAKRHANEIDAALRAARNRLDGYRAKAASASEATKERSQRQFPKFENDLDAESNRLASLKDQLAKLTQGRNDAIRTMVDHSPNHVAHNAGFLAQIIALEQIANEDDKIASVILLFELVSIGFELAAVLAKTLAYCPTTYSAMIAHDHYLRVVDIADDLTTRTGGDKSAADESDPVDMPKPPDPGNDNEPDGGSTVIDPFGMGDGTFTPPVDAPPPPRRGRGRPRKPRLH